MFSLKLFYSLCVVEAPGSCSVVPVVPCAVLCCTVSAALPLLPSVSQGSGADKKRPYSVVQAALSLLCSLASLKVASDCQAQDWL